MARETKIGLLVGMGFIVCFAIILSKRGGDHPSSSGRSYPTLSTASQPLMTPGTAEQRARDFGRDPRLEPNRGTLPLQPDRPGSDSPTMEPPVRSELAVAAPSEQRAPEASDRSLSDLLAGMQAESDEPIVPLAEAPPVLRRPTEPNHTAEENHALAGIRPAAPVAELPTVDEAPVPPPVPTRPYVVEKGDTLTRIAQKRYGTSSKDIVDAIFEANRKMLPGPDRLVIGQTLQLPERIGAVSAATGTETRSAKSNDRTPEKAPAAKPGPENLKKLDAPARTKGYRWYEVRKGDRYESIAKRELGDARRWKEVYELNKSIFPKASDIRWGVRIKLPEK
ncbi:MAG: LysM peptidoglycan-binding domain-containing protein [Phycisphaerae bacterium]|nr:LysM peptidoglycan-binding domain-containing protein [Phycisphaerae bacterium]